MERKYTTPNGIDVFSYPQAHLHSFCIGLYVKAGLLYERAEDMGITHFLEHVLFRNLGGMPQRELYERLEAAGAEFNACTYKEFVYFYITAAPQHFKECADIITKLLAPLTVLPGDVATERKRVQSEIREEDELNSTEYFAKQRVWKGTSLMGLITGTITGVAAIGAQRLAEAKQRDFTAGNMFFYVTGCHTPADVETLCERASRFHVAQGAQARRNQAPEPQGFMARGEGPLLRNTSELPSVVISFDMRCGKYTMAELNLLYDYLFSGTLSRFNQMLSEDRGLVYDYDAYLEQYSNIGSLYVSFSAMQSKLAEAIGVAAEAFRSAKRDINARALSLFLPEYTDNHLTALDRPQRLNWDMAYNGHILGKGYASVEELPEMYRAVTPERLMEIAGEIFRPENLVVAVKAQKKKIKEETIADIMAGI